MFVCIWLYLLMNHHKYMRQQWAVGVTIQTESKQEAILTKIHACSMKGCNYWLRSGIQENKRNGCRHVYIEIEIKMIQNPKLKVSIFHFARNHEYAESQTKLWQGCGKLFHL